MQKKNPYEMCDFMSVFPGRRSACSDGVGRGFYSEGSRDFLPAAVFFPLAEVSLVRSRLPLAQFSTVLHFLDHDNIV